jgi:hypothetical protein
VKKEEFNWDEEHKEPNHYKIGVGFFATKGIILEDDLLKNKIYASMDNKEALENDWIKVEGIVKDTKKFRENIS